MPQIYNTIFGGLIINLKTQANGKNLHYFTAFNNSICESSILHDVYVRA